MTALLPTHTIEGVSFTDYSKMSKEDWVVVWDSLLSRLSRTPSTKLSAFEILDDLEDRHHQISTVHGSFGCMHDPNQQEWSAHLLEKYLPDLERCETLFYQNDDLYLVIKEAYEKEGDSWSVSRQKQARAALRAFRESGCGLSDADKERLGDLVDLHSRQVVQFQALLTRASSEKMTFSPAQLDGLNPDIIKANMVGDSCVLLSTRSNINEILRSVHDRDVRRQVYQIDMARNTTNYPTEHIAKSLHSLRWEMAGLLGYETPAHRVLSDKMARTPDAVDKLLRLVWDGTLEKATQNHHDIVELAKDLGVSDFAPWDSLYFTEKHRDKSVGVTTAELAPYFTMRKVQDLALSAASDLFDLSFERTNAPAYHPSCETYLVRRHGEAIGGLIMDYQKREGKGPGAWMNNMHSQSGMHGSKPVVINVSSFYDGENVDQSISLQDALTVFHELGHALHSLLSNVEYPSQAGTNVARDFVELPSQLLENWITSKQGLLRAGLPEELASRAYEMGCYGQATTKCQYLVPAFMDMALHENKNTVEMSLDEVRSYVMDNLSAPSWIQPWHELPRFSHIWDGGYQAGYYGYLWAEVLEADVFSLFEHDLFDPTAKKAVNLLYASGGSRPEEQLFEEVMGRPLSEKPFMKRLGLEQKPPTMKM